MFDYATITGFSPRIHMHMCALRICQCGSMASTDTRLMPSSRPSFLPPPGRLTPWRWTQICTPWKAPTGSWTSEIPAGALSARSTRPPYSEAGSPQLILYPPAHCLPQYFFPSTLHPVLYPLTYLHASPVPSHCDGKASLRAAYSCTLL